MTNEWKVGVNFEYGKDGIRYWFNYYDGAEQRTLPLTKLEVNKAIKNAAVSKIEERCEFCKYFHNLEHNFKKGVGFEESHCCDVLLHIEDGTGLVQETEPTGMCEMFVRAEI